MTYMKKWKRMKFSIKHNVQKSLLKYVEVCEYSLSKLSFSRNFSMCNKQEVFFPLKIAEKTLLRKIINAYKVLLCKWLWFPRRLVVVWRFEISYFLILFKILLYLFNEILWLYVALIEKHIHIRSISSEAYNRINKILFVISTKPIQKFFPVFAAMSWVYHKILSRLMIQLDHIRIKCFFSVHKHNLLFSHLLFYFGAFIPTHHLKNLHFEFVLNFLCLWEKNFHYIVNCIFHIDANLLYSGCFWFSRLFF